MQSTVKLRELNEHVTCRLCAGYLIDATTITECLHTFCKTCIVKYLQTNKQCPICSTVVHETQPLLSLRPDRTMQDIVYKLVPGLFNTEQIRREQFYAERGVINPMSLDTGPPPMGEVEFSQTHFSRDDDLVSLQVEAHKSVVEETVQLKELTRKYIRCSSRVTVHHLKRFLLQMLGVPPHYDLDLLCVDNVLHKDSTLKFIWLSYWLKKDPPLALHYKLKRRQG